MKFRFSFGIAEGNVFTEMVYAGILQKASEVSRDDPGVYQLAKARKLGSVVA
jgi:hypothetical protein